MVGIVILFHQFYINPIDSYKWKYLVELLLPLKNALIRLNESGIYGLLTDPIIILSLWGGECLVWNKSCVGLLCSLQNSPKLTVSNCSRIWHWWYSFHFNENNSWPADKWKKSIRWSDVIKTTLKCRTWLCVVSSMVKLSCSWVNLFAEKTNTKQLYWNQWPFIEWCLLICVDLWIFFLKTHSPLNWVVKLQNRLNDTTTHFKKLYFCWWSLQLNLRISA